MASLKGRIIRTPSTFIDNVAFDLDESGDAWRGRFELPVGAAVEPGSSYRVELHDGRAGEARVTSYNTLSTKGELVGQGPLA